MWGLPVASRVKTNAARSFPMPREISLFPPSSAKYRFIFCSVQKSPCLLQELCYLCLLISAPSFPCRNPPRCQLNMPHAVGKHHCHLLPQPLTATSSRPPSEKRINSQQAQVWMEEMWWWVVGFFCTAISCNKKQESFTAVYRTYSLPLVKRKLVGTTY